MLTYNEKTDSYFCIKDQYLTVGSNTRDLNRMKDEQYLLASLHEINFKMPDSIENQDAAMLSDLKTSLNIERKMIDYESRFINMGDCPKLRPGGGADFVDELKSNIRIHVASKHKFYENYLPLQASVQDLAFYLTQETRLDPRFDDFIAYMQVGMPPTPKLELAKNYWDELGNGTDFRVHTLMFQNALDEVGATKAFIKENLMYEAVYGGNLSTLLAIRRNLLFRAIGNFAVTEYLFPRRCMSLLEAWKRLGLSEQGIEYHREHVSVDSKHSAGFFRNVIIPLVNERPEIAKEIYWGVHARLNTSKRYLDAMLNRLIESN